VKNFEYDPLADCAYISLSTQRIQPISTEIISENILVDRDGNGNIIGVELLFVRKLLKESEIK